MISRAFAGLVLAVVVALSLVPFAAMLLISVKSNAELFTNFWGFPIAPRWDHYPKAWAALGPYLVNTFTLIGLVVPGVVWLSSMAGYALARLRFPGRQAISAAILALLMVPGILTLIPTYGLVKQLGLIDTPWALILPYLAGGQVLGVVLSRTFFAGIDEELFEAMRLDGASDLVAYRRLALPLSMPVLSTIAIMTSLGIYNDYIWPLVAVSDNARQTFTVGVTRFASSFNMEYGPTMAGYVVGSIPLMVLFAFGMRSFVRGVTAGALKG